MYSPYGRVFVQAPPHVLHIAGGFHFMYARISIVCMSAYRRKRSPLCEDLNALRFIIRGCIEPAAPHVLW
jgi:hypothetical protein